MRYRFRFPIEEAAIQTVLREIEDPRYWNQVVRAVGRVVERDLASLFLRGGDPSWERLKESTLRERRRQGVMGTVPLSRTGRFVQRLLDIALLPNIGVETDERGWYFELSVADEEWAQLWHDIGAVDLLFGGRTGRGRRSQVPARPLRLSAAALQDIKRLLFRGRATDIHQVWAAGG